MKLFHWTRDDGDYGIGVELDGQAFDFSAIGEEVSGGASEERHSASSIDELIEQGRASGACLRGVLASVPDLERFRLMDFRMGLPLRHVGKIIAIARNYRAHAEEMGSSAPEEAKWFAKFPSTMLPDGAVITLPSSLGARVDHEVELGAIIGKPARKVNEADAMGYVAGYTILNDLTARDLQAQAKKTGMPWTAAKNFDNSLPCGPYFVPADEVADPQALEIRCDVNGEVRQLGSSADMIHSIAALVSKLSHHLTLHAGDMIATGTPSGVGPLEDGDRITCSIQGLGSLSNTVRRIP